MLTVTQVHVLNRVGMQLLLCRMLHYRLHGVVVSDLIGKRLVPGNFPLAVMLFCVHNAFPNIILHFLNLALTLLHVVKTTGVRASAHVFLRIKILRQVHPLLDDSTAHL